MHVAVMRQMNGRKAHIKIVGDGNIDVAVNLVLVVVAVFAVDRARKHIGRGRRYHADIAAERVSAIQRALRAALHLHAREIEQGDALLLRAALVNAVEIKTDDRIVLRAHQAGARAADGGERVRSLLAPGETRCHVLQSARIVDMRAGEVACGQRGDSHRHVQQFFASALRCHHHFLKRCRCGWVRRWRRWLRPGAAGGADARERARQHQRLAPRNRC
jgi:hypothetical protein